jgi:hypothetical protein
LDLPLVLTRQKRQVAAVDWLPDYFTDGLIINGATVEIVCYVAKDQVGDIKNGDRVILRIFLPGSERPMLLEQTVGEGKSGCFIVTFCFGTDSYEYRKMITFRDQVLLLHPLGKQLVILYYGLSPRIVKGLRKYRIGSWIGSWVLRRMIRLFISFYIFFQTK